MQRPHPHLGKRKRTSQESLIHFDSLLHPNSHHHFIHLSALSPTPTTMVSRGERFEIDLDSHADGPLASHKSAGKGKQMLTPAFVGDIKERPATKQPEAPSLAAATSASTGFPPPKKRSRFTASKESGRSAASNDGPTPQKPPSQLQATAPEMTPVFEQDERALIHQENEQRLAAMTEAEIEQERRELLDVLSPSLIHRLLKRANLDDGRGDTGIEPPCDVSEGAVVKTSQGEVAAGMPSQSALPSAPDLKTAQEPEPKPEVQPKASSIKAQQPPLPFDPDAPPTLPPADLHPASAKTPLPPARPIHFPPVPPPTTPLPDLDPAAADFPARLHETYFPTLAPDPSKLAWMAPLPAPDSAADQTSAYSPTLAALPPSALRFDFSGRLLTPRAARRLPTTLGLHHHSAAPEAAGYSVPELARLARSAVPAQRCLAFQTLGRVLFRLGRGEWGDEGAEVPMGLWRCVEEGGVLPTLQLAAARERGPISVRNYALEALWNWQRGGGRRWKAD
ncbi:MAG: hypothetical protein M1829_002568 [Trizodia sp. TS-e1964]|nr:MAG: hypothetical protein M1829_002568 [Trizodia sp. TS-e1964]